MTSIAEIPGVFDELAPPLDEESVVLEAERCLECGGPYAPAPCVVACPAGVDVPSFVAALAGDDPAGAAATIFAENLLGGTCARVCPVEELCAARACSRRPDGVRSTSRALQRYATDWAFEHGHPLRARTGSVTAAASQ